MVFNVVAQNNDIQDYKSLIDNVLCEIEKFEEYAKRVDIDKKLTQNIKNHLNILY